MNSSVNDRSQAPAAPARTARDLIAVVYRRAGLIAVCVIAGGAVSLLLSLRQPRVYASSAKVWVQVEQQGWPSIVPGITAHREGLSPEPINRRIETEIALMRTRANAQAVVEKYAIDASQLVHRSAFKPRAQVEAASAAALARDRRSQVIDLFLDGVSVEPLRSKAGDAASDVLEVRFECTDPALATMALQSFLDNYLQFGAQQKRRLGESVARRIEARRAQAGEELRQSQERIVALLVRDVGSSGRGVGNADGATRSGLKLDLDLGGAVTGAGARTLAGRPEARPQTLGLRLDEARQRAAGDAGRAQQGLARTVRENTPLGAQLNRLERARQLVQERYIDLQRELDEVDQFLRGNPIEADSRVVVNAPGPARAVGGRNRTLVASPGLVAGLVLGLLLATLREFGGDRMRSPREAERALGVPVLGAIPTLSAKARKACFGPAAAAPESRA